MSRLSIQLLRVTMLLSRILWPTWWMKWQICVRAKMLTTNLKMIHILLSSALSISILGIIVIVKLMHSLEGMSTKKFHKLLQSCKNSSNNTIKRSLLESLKLISNMENFWVSIEAFRNPTKLCKKGKSCTGKHLQVQA